MTELGELRNNVARINQNNIVDTNESHSESDDMEVVVKKINKINCQKANTDTYIRLEDPNSGEKYINNWTPSIENKLKEIREKYRKYIWANNSRSQYFKKMNRAHQIINIVITGLAGTLFAYLSSIGSTSEFTFLGLSASVISYILFVNSGIQLMFKPDEKVSEHDAASVAFSDSLYNLERQLSIPVELREKGDDLYSWIIREHIILLSNTPKIYPKWFKGYDKAAKESKIEDVLNPENEGRFYSSKCKMDIPFIV